MKTVRDGHIPAFYHTGFSAASMEQSPLPSTPPLLFQRKGRDIANKEKAGAMIAPARRGLYENKLWLPVIGPVVPNLVAKVPAEEASYFFRTKVFAVEESSRGEVVGISADNELLVRSQVLFRVVLYVSKTAENAFGDVILQQGQLASFTLAVSAYPQRRISALYGKQMGKR